MTRSMACVLLLCSTTLAAQQPPLAGTWEVSYPGGMRIENGVGTPLIASGVLTIEVVNDSLIGSLATTPSAEMPARPPVRLAGKAASADAVLVSSTKATININGNKQEATAVSTWTLRASGDSLSGTVARRLEGLDAGEQGPQPVTGTRRKP